MIKVFLVDDEIVIRESIRTAFPREESGYTLVGEAPDGEVALPMIRDANPDILITDIRMPFMDGMALCPEDRKRDGIIGDLSIRENIYLALQARRGMMKPMTRKEQNELADKYIKMLSIATPETSCQGLFNQIHKKATILRFYRL